MMLDIENLTDDTDNVAWVTVPGRTRRVRTMGAAQYAVVEEAVKLVGDRTGITEEAEV